MCLPDHAVTSCPACGGPLRAWRSAPSSEPADPRRYDLARCARCGTAVTLGEPPGEEAHDSGAYRAGTPRLSRLAAPLLAAFDRARLRLLGHVMPPPALLLDAGAGRGRFVAHAREAGYAAIGIEPSVRGVEGAAAIGVSLTRATIEEADVESGSLDAVTLWHVLEHVDDPTATVARIRDWLAPGGALLVGVPNLASWQARLGGERWYHLDLPRHRTHFTAAGLRTLLAGQGLEVVMTTHVLAEHNPFGMWQSAMSRLTTHPSYLYNLLKRNVGLDARDLTLTLLGLALLPVAILAELVAGVCRRGGTVAVLARRQGTIAE